METDNLAKDTTCAPPNDTLREPVDTGGPFKGKYSTASKMSQPGQDLEVPPPAKTLRVSLSWNPRLLELALACFPATNLRLWFEWIVRDVVQNRASFPDLVQFRLSERRYRMVEIKGPGDRLQENQLRFLKFCTEHRMPVFVCWVRCAEGAIRPRSSLDGARKLRMRERRR